MRQIFFLRHKIFKANQAEFARMAQVSQATVSRWENGEGSPSLENIIALRQAAARNGIAWDHEWLFSAPSDEVSA
ncbi:helix-turn-helix domain-containing protein [Brucella anthropi]|uniref:helix-turn-helix domain-containing protein n=1 Tax=Brucella anthropi TaxID=529 RepID=UPI003CC7F598